MNAPAHLPLRPLVALALVAWSGLLVHHASFLNRPFGSTLDQEVAATWMARGTRLGAGISLEEGCGLLVWQHVPGTELLIPYVNHPPLSGWLARLSWELLPHGPAHLLSHEGAIRLPFLVAGMLLALLPLLVLRGPRRTTGALGTLVLCVAPGLHRFGMLPNFEPWCALLAGCAACTWAAWRRRPSRLRLAGTWAFLALGTLADWPAAFLVVPLVADLLLVPAGSRRRSLGLCGLLATAPLLAAGLHAALAARALGSWQEAGEALVAALGKTHMVSPSPAALPGGPLAHVPRLLSWPLLVLAGAGLVLLPRASPVVRRAALLLGTAGLLQAGVFAFHAAQHAFWSYHLLLPGALLGAVAGAQALEGAARHPRLLHVVFALLLAAAVVATAQGLQARRHALRGGTRALVPTWRQVFTPLDVVIAHRELRPLGFHVESPIFRLTVPEPGAAQRLLQRIPQSDTVRGVHLLLFQDEVRAHPRLAAWAEVRALDRREVAGATVWRLR